TEGRVIGMVSTHDQPPFSVADRLTDPSILERPGTRPLEVRLLAIEPARRNSTVVLGLMMSVYEHAQTSGYTHLYSSAVEEPLANEVVGATLAADPAEQEARSSTRGVLLVNGEFGQRLAKQAGRFGLRPRVLTWDWGQPWDLDEVEASLAVEPPGSWVWGVHQ